MNYPIYSILKKEWKKKTIFMRTDSYNELQKWMKKLKSNFTVFKHFADGSLERGSPTRTETEFLCLFQRRN